MTKQEYDGFHFLPDPEIDGGYVFQFFKLNKLEGNDHSTDVIGSTTVGDMYNVLLMREREETVEITDIFQAIFADPTIYAEGLIGSDHYGTFVKNTEHSKEWWESYVKKTCDVVKEFNTTGEINGL